MASRRTVLAAVATGLAGCAGQRSRETPTVTAVPTPSDAAQYPAAVVDALGSSRFDDTDTCPTDRPCFHRLSPGDRPDTVAVPDRELVSPTAPEARIEVYNLTDSALVVAAEPYVAKDTGIAWAPTVPFHGTTATRVIEPGESLTRRIGIAGRGDGRYVLVERARSGGPRGTMRMTVERGADGEDDRFRFGAMVEVRGSDWELTPTGIPAERDGETLRFEPDRTGAGTLVLETADQSEGLPIIPETIAAHAPTTDAVLGLRRDGVERTKTPTGERSMQYIRSGLRYPQPIDEERTLRVGDVRFVARVE
jgi:hypothetical protein